jgi:hypothetical protein
VRDAVVMFEPGDRQPQQGERSFQENEKIISRGLGTFVEVGRALMDIRASRQYLNAGFDSFDDYCRGRWGLDKTQVSRHINGAKVVNSLEVADPQLLPANIEQATPLISILNSEGEDAVRNAWDQIVESHDGDEPITGREIRAYLNPAASLAPSQRPLSDAYLGALDKLGPAMKSLRWAIKKGAGKKIPKPVQERFALYAITMQALTDAVREIGDGESPDPKNLEVGIWDR